MLVLKLINPLMEHKIIYKRLRQSVTSFSAICLVGIGYMEGRVRAKFFHRIKVCQFSSGRLGQFLLDHNIANFPSCEQKIDTGKCNIGLIFIKKNPRCHENKHKWPCFCLIPVMMNSRRMRIILTKTSHFRPR